MSQVTSLLRQQESSFMGCLLTTCELAAADGIYSVGQAARQER